MIKMSNSKSLDTGPNLVQAEATRLSSMLGLDSSLAGIATPGVAGK